MDPIVRAKLGYAAGAVFACLFILLGIYTLSSIFSSALNSGPVWQSNVNLRYVFAAIGGLFLGAVLLLMTIPVFIPIKHKIWLAPQVCPRCGALADGDAEVCGKCGQQLELDDTEAA